MDTESPNPATGDPASELSTPGRQLRAERERRGIGVAAAAKELRLSEVQLRALEAGDYSQMPPASFIRGYLRSYARLLQMDGDALVTAFDTEAGPAGEPTLVVHSAGTGHSAFSSRMAVVLLMLAAALGAGAWWLVNESTLLDGGYGADDPSTETTMASAEADSEATESGDTASAEDGETASGEMTPTPDEADAGGSVEAEPIQQELTEVEPVDSDSASVDSGQPIVLDPDLLFPRIETDPDLVAERDADVEALFGQVPPETGTVAAAPASEGDEPAASATPEVTIATTEEALTSADIPGPDLLTVQVAGESWVEVYDDRERQLAYRLYRDGETLQLRGWAPFEVYLGNAPDVRVELEGEPIEIDTFVRSNDTARFEVDADGVRFP